MDNTTFMILLIMLGLVGGFLGITYYKNRHLVKAPKKKLRKKDKQFWSIE